LSPGWLAFACYEIYMFSFGLVVYLFLFLLSYCFSGLLRGIGFWFGDLGYGISLSSLSIVFIVFVSCEVSCNSQLWLFFFLSFSPFVPFFSSLPFLSFFFLPCVAFSFSKNSRFLLLVCPCKSGTVLVLVLVLVLAVVLVWSGLVGSGRVWYTRVTLYPCLFLWVLLSACGLRVAGC